jgi:KipI family sensor histidine kinase inhibitor
MPVTDCQLSALGDRAILLRLAERIDAALNRRVHALAAGLKSWPEFSDIVPAYASIALHLAPGVWLDAALESRLQSWLATVAPPTPEAGSTDAVELAVRFDGEDLDAVAQAHGLDVATLIRRLCGGDYQVAMLGFLPGFPYLLGLDPALALPRRAQPRTHVPPNTLALGGAQLGVYPCGSPGGWHLLGTLKVPLFDPARDRPALLAPGDRVRIVALDGRR